MKKIRLITLIMICSAFYALSFSQTVLDPNDQGVKLAERLKKFLGETDVRPEFGWYNLEDLLYHDQRFAPELENHPDIWIFGRKRVWVFNRAMEWRRDEQQGTILCYCPTNGLSLTGEKQVSSWHSAPPNIISQAGDYTLFKMNSGRACDAAVLPAFQFHLGQNPVIEMDVTETDAEWQLCVSIKGRGGAPMLASPWKKGNGKVTFDLEKELRKRGYEFQYPELHFAIALWTPTPAGKSQIKFRLSMPGHGAVVASLPVVRTIQRAEKDGVPVAATALSATGQLLGAGKVHLFATIAGRKVALTEEAGVWKTVLHNLPVGDHEVTITSEGDLISSARSVVRITDGMFYKYDKVTRWVSKEEKPLGPLSGSYQGTFYFKDAGLPSEHMIQGQKEWDKWDRKKSPGVHMNYWEAMKPRELDERFNFIAKNGFDLTTLHSHWGLWERLDAGGRIAPHAAEQLALYMRAESRYGLAHLQALASGPYGVPDAEKGYGDTVPYSIYLEEGFKIEDWFKPGGRFSEMFHQYIKDFTTLFRDETALFGITASGEGDFTAPGRAEDVFKIFREQDPNHIVLAEAIISLNKLPEKICAPYPQDMLGGRTYSIATNKIAPEFDLGVEFKFYKTVNNAYLAEGSWPPMPDYTRFHYEVRKDDWGSRISWTGTSMYRVRLRETLYLGLVHRLPIMNTWDEEMAEDEHLILKEIRGLVNWDQKFIEPEVAVFVNDSCATTNNPARQKIARYEESFARMPLAYRLYTTPEPPSGTLVTFDGRQPFSVPEFKSKGGSLPDELKSRMPLEISESYCAGYTWSEDRRTLLAFCYNTADHLKEYQWLGGNFQRNPQPKDFRVAVKNVPAGSLHYRLYDLNEKKVCREVVAQQPPEWSLGVTDHDFFLLVTPK